MCLGEASMERSQFARTRFSFLVVFIEFFLGMVYINPFRSYVERGSTNKNQDCDHMSSGTRHLTETIFSGVVCRDMIARATSLVTTASGSSLYSCCKVVAADWLGY